MPSAEQTTARIGAGPVGGGQALGARRAEQMSAVHDERSEHLMHEVQRELVRSVQRGWLMSALARVVCEHGAEGASVRQIVACAGVSRRRFYELFASSDDCFRAVFEDAIGQVRIRASRAYGIEGAWSDRLRAGLFAVLAYFDSEPELARLLVLHTTATGPATARRNELLWQLIDFIDSEGRAANPASNPPPLTGETVVGGVLGVIQARLSEDGEAPLTSLVNPLMSVIALPYLGPEAAWEELARPVHAAVRTPPQDRAERNAPGDLDMRLTYRTLRVLAEIAAAPGISNQAVAEAAGIRDQGQISKLLSRVEGLGLIRNAGAGQAKGRPNAWHITHRGAAVGRDLGQRLRRDSSALHLGGG
ncbi:MAG: TetR family transcriptional regulator [Solirubrobacterales bacterium]